MQIVIAVDGIDPLRGQVTSGTETPVAFSGWLPLLGILERLTTSAGVPPDDGGDELGPGGH
jgi:hypothetical protein